ncbi:allophanate hydrolase, partial [Bacillus sp. AFS076308]
MKLRVEVVALDCLMVRLFDEISEANMPWMLAASENLRAAFGEHLIDLVPSYTTLMVHYDLIALNPAQARELIAQAL